MTNEEHDELAELLGPYALDAVDPDERDRIEAHLRECPRCRAEVAGHHEAASLLARGAPAPTELWQRISDNLETRGEPLPAMALRPRPSRRRRVAVVVAAVAAAVVVVALGARVVEQERRLDQLATELAGDSVRRGALAALADPASREVELTSPDDRRAAEVVWLPDGSGYFLARELPSLAPDRTYQLWALRDGLRISAGVLGPEVDVAAFRVAGPVDGFAVTEETAGGVPTSAQTPVVIGYR